MLKSLYIKNVAIISKLNIEFDGGLNILSGETGAGKSIIIDSLNFVLGGKADKSLIRYGEEIMSVDALFEIGQSVRVILSELGFEEDDELALSRSLSLSGKSDVRINGRQTSVSVLKNITQYLCDVYGQSEHISLLKTSNHLKLVDAFAGPETAKVRDELGGHLTNLREINAEIESFGGNPEERERLLDLYAFQIKEIEETALEENEEEELGNLRSVLAHAEKISEALSSASGNLSNSDCGAADLISKAFSELSAAAKYDERLAEFLPRLESIRFEAEDIAESLDSALGTMDFDEGKADRVFERLDKIKSLKRKYGNGFAAIQEYYEKTKAEFSKIQNAGERISELNADKAKLLKKIESAANRLTALRKASASELSGKLNAEFASLAMKNASFEVEFAENSQGSVEERVTSEGFDRVQFLFSANTGEPLKPLEKVISGGEMSRFMLAIKQLTADLDEIGTQVFDEADSGISGAASVEIAKKIAGIAKYRQVISITHTAAVVAVADANFFIEKRVEDGKTLTNLRKLDDAERAAEVARLLGAIGKNEFGVKHAEELLGWGEEFKKSL